MVDRSPFRSPQLQAAYLQRHESRSQAWPKPFVERSISTSWGETHVCECGNTDAPALVMLPGVGSPAYTLARLATMLAGDFHIFGVDNIYDNGRSVANRPLKSADDFASWLDDLFDALKLTRPNLLGLSYGGWITAQYALRRSERLDRAVLLAPAGTIAPINFAFIWRAIFTLIAPKTGMRIFFDWSAPTMASNSRWREERSHFIDDALLGMRAFVRRRLVPPLPLSDEQWSKIETPTLVLFGDLEVIFDPQMAAAKLAKVAPQIRVEMIVGESHDFFVTAAEGIAKHVTAFLRTPRSISRI